jgi:mannose-6-phosphate isomerase-like protein (cupin superfamily)/DNA-binding XRE family transcriptional regulator
VTSKDEPEPQAAEADACSANGGAPPRIMVGRRIRSLRTASGKSLRQVADDLGIAPSALSMLENDHTGVSLQRLQLIARYFNVTIVALLTETDVPADDVKPAAVQVIRRVHATSPSVTRGKGVVYQLPGAGGGHLLQTAVLTFQPGGGYERDQIAHSGEEMVYVTIGTVQLHFGDQVLELEQGDMAVFRTETPHAFRNASELGPAMLIAVATPPW